MDKTSTLDSTLPIKSGRRKLPPKLKRTIRREMSFNESEYIGWKALMEITGLTFRELIRTMYLDKCKEYFEQLLAHHVQAVRESCIAIQENPHV